MSLDHRPELPSPRRARRGGVGTWLRAVGVLCLFGALGTAGYIVWVQWGTGYLTARSQDRLRTQFERQVVRAERGAPPSLKVSLPGQAVAVLEIGRMDLDMVVVEGTSPDDLKKGPGHYRGTAYPWDEGGRVGVAGHRTTYLHPFWSLDKLRPGDDIRLRTEFGTYDYRVTGSRVVLPSDVSILRQTPDPTLVLTACEPRFSAAKRLVVFAQRIAGTGAGPPVEVPSGGPVPEVGPGDNVGRPFVVSLAGSFGVGALYLGMVGLVRRRRSARDSLA
jgi:sortase A